MVDSNESSGPPGVIPNCNPSNNEPSERDLVDSIQSFGTLEETPDHKNEPSESDNIDGNKSSGLPEETPYHNSNENELLENASIFNLLNRLAEESINLPMAQHKFWESQPVWQFKDMYDPDLPDGPIEVSTPLSEVKQEPYDLPSMYEWVTCDIGSDEIYSEIFNLLENNYFRDDEDMFRFKYSKGFLRWALCPPGYFKSWHIGIRDKRSKSLVAFIAGVPAKIRVCDETFTMAEVNFFCVQKNLRSKGFAPILIKEVTRRVHLENIWQAAFATESVISAPITSCQYWHRSLTPQKLIDLGFATLGPTMTLELFKLPESISTPGFRKMEVKDVPAVTSLLRKYLSDFVVAPDFSEEDVKHWLLPTEGVVDSYVVENSETNLITDFCSFYTLISPIVGNQNYSSIKTAISYYNVSTSIPLVQLMSDALFVAKQKDLDFFSALTIMENQSFLSELKFEPGDGCLHYYLYNFRFQHAVLPSDIGLVLL